MLRLTILSILERPSHHQVPEVDAGQHHVDPGVPEAAHRVGRLPALQLLDGVLPGGHQDRGVRPVVPRT